MLIVDFPAQCSIIVESVDDLEDVVWKETQPVMDMEEEEIRTYHEQEGDSLHHPKDVTPDDISVFFCNEAISNLIVDFPGNSPSKSTNDGTTTDAIPRAVTFATSPQIKCIEDLSLTELKPKLWYTESDMDSFVHDNNKNVTMLKILQRFAGGGNSRGGGDDTMSKYARQRMEQANTTPMGLENHLGTVGSVNMTDMSMRRDAHCEAVLEEQLRQLELLREQEQGEGCREAREDAIEAIANVSREKSAWSRNRARVIGTLHAEADACTSILRAGKVLGLKRAGPSLSTPPSA